MSTLTTTTDHNTIRQWVEEHDGVPMKVKSTEKGNSALLRIGFPDNKYSDSDNLEEISWNDFFKIFDEKELTLLYDPKKDNLFTKLISRNQKD